MRISDWSSDVCSSDLQLGSSSSSSLDGNILSEQTHLVAVRRAKQVRPQNGHFLAKAQLAAGDVEAGAHQIHPRALPAHAGEEIRVVVTPAPDRLEDRKSTSLNSSP